VGTFGAGAGKSGDGTGTGGLVVAADTGVDSCAMLSV
jgi:hypothetical protein